jgi:hypothetical protein
MSKLDLKYELAALDGKDRDFYDSLTEDERKKFSAYILLKYGANAEGSTDIQEYYLLSANEQNKNFWDLNKHPKLQWLAVSAISPGIGSVRHYWLKAASTAKTKKQQRLLEMFPYIRPDELEILDAINSDDDITRHDEQSGEDVPARRRKRK